MLRPSRCLLSRTPRAGLALLLAAIVLAAASSGCEPGSVTPAASAACAEAGAQCQLPQGPLGVCERSACARGAAPPCFVCTPQH